MTSGFDRLEQELRHAEARDGSRRRALPKPMPSRLLSRAVVTISVLVTLAIAAGAMVLLHSANRDVVAPTSSGRASHYTDPQGWSITVPGTLTLTRVPGRGLAGLDQITLASFPPQRELTQDRHVAEDNITEPPFAVPLDASGAFPADGVALILEPSPAGFLVPDSRFPIVLSSFGASRSETFLSKTVSDNDAVPASRSRVIVAYGSEVTATVLIGGQASPALEEQLANVIRSLRFPRLHPGSQAGNGVLLQPAVDYPVGSFTRAQGTFGITRESFYLVHAPGRLGFGHQCVFEGPCVAAGSFYGIGPLYNTRLNHAPKCDLQFDRPDEQFYCTNLGVRWDRVGRVITRPADEAYIGSIEGFYARVAWDGQVLVTAGWGPQLNRPAVHKLWPNWNQPNEPLSR